MACLLHLLRVCPDVLHPTCLTCVYMLPVLFRTRNKLSFKKLTFFLKLFKMQKFKKKRTALERTQFCCQLKLDLEFSFQIITMIH